MLSKDYYILAAIDIGSNLIRMSIAQVNLSGEITILEDLRHNTQIGIDTFSYNKISAPTIKETCTLLMGFKEIISQYEVDDFWAISTSGIRDAENKDYVLEQIKLKTNIMIDIINDSQENFLIYKSIYNELIKIDQIKEKGALIAYVGAGGIEISIFNNGKLIFSDYIRLGSLRLKELLNELKNDTNDFTNIMEEYVDNILYPFSWIVKRRNLGYFIALGGTSKDLLFRKFEKKTLSRDEFKEFYLKIKNFDEFQIENLYNTDSSNIELVIPSLVIYYKLLNMTKANEVYISLNHSLRLGMISEMIDKLSNSRRKIALQQDIISSVRFIARKYKINHAHCRYVERQSLYIFDKVKDYMNLNDKSRLYLQIAAILHDIGTYINLYKEETHCYNIIKNEHILGISDKEYIIIANIAKYHNKAIPSEKDIDYSLLSFEDKMLVSKLSSILRLAKALDISHKQKITNINIRKLGDNLYFEITSKCDYLLEEWDFKEKSSFFHEISGLKPILIRKEL
ncbi:Ppx/GppA phosphatase family protein [Clostridium sp. DL1XJH146]